MSKKKKLKVEKLKLDQLPCELLVLASQLETLSDYEYETQGVVFESGNEFRVIKVLSQKLNEEKLQDEEL